jgi:hypothetical protein
VLLRRRPHRRQAHVLTLHVLQLLVLARSAGSKGLPSRAGRLARAKRLEREKWKIGRRWRTSIGPVDLPGPRTVGTRAWLAEPGSTGTQTEVLVGREALRPAPREQRLLECLTKGLAWWRGARSMTRCERLVALWARRTGTRVWVAEPGSTGTQTEVLAGREAARTADRV